MCVRDTGVECVRGKCVWGGRLHFINLCRLQSCGSCNHEDTVFDLRYLVNRFAHYTCTCTCAVVLVEIVIVWTILYV